MSQPGSIRDFIQHQFRHFNAAVVKDAAQGWVDFVEQGGKMVLTMGGAMSTAELGVSVAELIRRKQVHALCVTGANLEEDLFNLVAHAHYERLPHYRDLGPEDEVALLKRGLNRVTDTCIPEQEAMRRVEGELLKVWQKAAKEGRRGLPYEFLFELLRSGRLEQYYQADPRDSWMLAACEANIPVWCPGWEDSTLGNMFVSERLKGGVGDIHLVKSGLELMAELIDWYRATSKDSSVGFFQIAGGISGDFPICVVPLIEQDLREPVRKWGYFCQISDSTTSYGSYSGAVPNEKITWGKLEVGTPSFVIESDATIVFPLVAAYVLGQ